MAEGDLSANVVKGGITCIQTLISRRPRKAGDPQDWKGGLFITVKTIPEVEEFMQNLGAGETVDVGTVGRHWQALRGEGLNAYIIRDMKTNYQSADGSTISLDKLGSQLLIPNPDGSEKYPMVNLSFLRLRGIGEGAGVTFGVKGVYSYEEMCRIRDKLTAAQVRFYNDYVRPVDLLMTVFSSTQEVRF